MTRLVISDIDGTLVADGTGEGGINTEYFTVIDALYQRGIRFVVCSGRQYHSMYRLLRPVADKIFFICEGGGLVRDDSGRIIHAKALPPDTVSDIISDAKKVDDVDIMVAGTQRSYCADEDSELYRWMRDAYGFDIQAVGDLEKGLDDDVLKVSLYHKDRIEELTAPWFRPRWEKKVKLNLAGIQWLDLVSWESGKGRAVSFLQEYLKIGKGETIVFGDNQNDIEMFGCAGTSYAVEGARDEVIRFADRVCPGYKEDGVLQVLKNI